MVWTPQEASSHGAILRRELSLEVSELQELLDAQQVAEFLRYRDKASVRKLVKRGQLPVAARGSRRQALFRPEDVLALMELRAAVSSSQGSRARLPGELREQSTTNKRKEDQLQGRTKPRRRAVSADAVLPEAELCPNTRDRYERSVRQALKPYFMRFNVEDLTKAHVERWRAALLEAGFARSTINSHHRVLKTLLRSAGNEATCKVTYLNEKPDARIHREEPNLLTMEEVSLFIEGMQRMYPQHYPLTLTLFATALRISAALALRWEDIDLDTHEFVVRRRISGSGASKSFVPGVKRDRFGEDLPPLVPGVMAVLEEHRSSFNPRQLESGLIFPSPRTGGVQSRSVLNKPFAAVLADVGITKRFTVHGCRRTASKVYKAAAGPQVAVAGHTTEAMHHHYAPVVASE